MPCIVQCIFLRAKVKGNENKDIYMSFYYHIFIVCNLMSRRINVQMKNAMDKPFSYFYGRFVSNS